MYIFFNVADAVTRVSIDETIEGTVNTVVKERAISRSTYGWNGNEW